MHMDISMHIIMFIMRLKPFAILKGLLSSTMVRL